MPTGMALCNKKRFGYFDFSVVGENIVVNNED
jgi:hypothetical protein